MKADAFRDQVVIITDALSCIGWALARQQGVKVVLAVRPADLLTWKNLSC